MKKRFLLLTGAIALFISACGDPYVSVAAQEKVDAAELKIFCEQKKIANEETKQADALFTQGQTALTESSSASAYTALGQAASLYKIALAGFHANKANAKITTLEQDLQKDQEALKGYQNLLSSINNQPTAPVAKEITDEK